MNKESLLDVWKNQYEEKISKLKQQNETYENMIKVANEIKNIQGHKGNYDYDIYMLGLYNGMEMIIAIFEGREPNFIDDKDIDFIHDYKKQLADIKFYIEQSDIKNMLWGKEILKIIDKK